MSLLETKRLALQAILDGKKTQAARNKLGQFATPTTLARDVLEFGLNLLPSGQMIRFLDPAIGTGSFYSALMATSIGRQIKAARGFEVDTHYGDSAKSLWKDTPLEIFIGDFTQATPPVRDRDRPNFLICNPPYVRHHHLDAADKARLQRRSFEAAKIHINGLAGLYCHFIAIAHQWMAEGGIAGWLIPSEFMDVNYGRDLKKYLLCDVTLLHIHRFDPNNVQFDDALVSSAVVWFRKEKPKAGHKVHFSYGGSLQAPVMSKDISIIDLMPNDKWTKYPKQDPSVDHAGYRLGDLFAIKRGLATGNNKFFILDEVRAQELELPAQFLRPILPSSRYVTVDEIHADSAGVPLLDKRLFLLDCDQPEDVIQRDFPSLWAYLQTGLEGVSGGYLCQSRRYWYAQEKRKIAPIVFTYIGRSDHARKPFRFLLNETKAVATNVYLMLYPQPLITEQLKADPTLIRTLWVALNSIPPEILLGNGRVYGGGMHKLEPKELFNVPADKLAAIIGLSKRAVS